MKPVTPILVPITDLLPDLLRLTQAFIRKYSEDATFKRLGGYLDKVVVTSAMNADAS